MTKRWLAAAVVMVAVACGAPEVEGPAGVEPLGTTEAELARGASLHGWAPMGFCDELREVLGVTPGAGFPGVPRALSCFNGYGVDGVAFFGPVSVGYPLADPAGRPLTASVNGRQTAVMDAQLSGTPAQRLFAAMKRTFSAQLPSSKVQSRTGALVCEQLLGGPFVCQVRSLSGFTVP